jgi:LacI family transcriptional regulator
MEFKNSTTIDDIAKKAEVSISTVSRVLTGSAPVADETREAVLAAMRELKYQPNVFARGLAKGRSMTIGVLTQHIGNPFYEGIMTGILQGLSGSGYSLIFADGRFQPEIELEAVQNLVSRRVDGMIVIGGNLSEESLCEIREQVPLIVVGRKVSCFPEHCLFVDQILGARIAMDHLIRRGHHHIAFVSGDLTQQDALDRRTGYFEAQESAGIVPNSDLIIEGEFHEQSGLMAIEMLISRNQSFSAIFTSNDQMAFGVYLGLFRHSLRIPQDVSVVGFDDQATSAYIVPPLTTVRQPANEMGEIAGNSILELIAGNQVVLPELEPCLIVRESVIRR